MHRLNVEWCTVNIYQLNCCVRMKHYETIWMIHTAEIRKTNSARLLKLSMINKVSKVKKNVHNLDNQHEVQETKRGCNKYWVQEQMMYICIVYICKWYAYTVYLYSVYLQMVRIYCISAYLYSAYLQMVRISTSIHDTLITALDTLDTRKLILDLAVDMYGNFMFEFPCIIS